MPVTLNSRPLMRIDWPTAPAPSPKRSSRVVGPSTATFDAETFCVSEINDPSATSTLRICGYALVTPVIDVFVFVPLAVTWYRSDTCESTARISATFPPIASASSFVSVFAPPRPADAPNPCVRCAPGVTCIRFEPSDSIEDEILFEAHVPIETIAMTDEMPITIPRIVSPERPLFAESAAYVSCVMSLNFLAVFGVLPRMLFVIRDNECRIIDERASNRYTLNLSSGKLIAFALEVRFCHSCSDKSAL